MEYRPIDDLTEHSKSRARWSLIVLGPRCGTLERVEREHRFIATLTELNNISENGRIRNLEFMENDDLNTFRLPSSSVWHQCYSMVQETTV
jgi:hypothetical protein